MPTPKTYILKCPGCGAGLKVGEAVDSFACTYCGASVQVERGEGIVSLRLITDAISKVQRGTDRTAAELALVRIPKEITAAREEQQRLGKLRDEAIARAKLMPQPAEPDFATIVGAIRAGRTTLYTSILWAPFSALMLVVGASERSVAMFLMGLAIPTAIFVGPAYLQSKKTHQEAGKAADAWNQSPARQAAIAEVESLSKRDDDLQARLIRLNSKLAEAQAVVDN